MNAYILRLPALLLLIASMLRAQVPQLLNYQGRIVAGAANFEGTGQFKFALVDGAGSTTYWSNDGSSTAGSEPATPVSLTVTKGLYSVQLGDTSLTHMTAVPTSVFMNADVHLRIWFDDGTHGSQLLTPDQRITAVGYAIMAGNVPDGSITSAKIADGAIGSSQLATGLSLNGTLIGNAATATSATSFTGSLVGDVTGSQSATVVASVGGVTAANLAAVASLANAATSGATPGTLVTRDNLGSIAVNVVSANGGIVAGGAISTTIGDISTGIGNISTANGGIYAFGNIISATGGISVASDISTMSGDISTAFGNISAGGGISTTSGDIYTAFGNISGRSITANGDITTVMGSITASGDITTNNGSLNIGRGTININGGRINCSGGSFAFNIPDGPPLFVAGESGIYSRGDLRVTGSFAFMKSDGQPFIAGSEMGLYVTGGILIFTTPDGQPRMSASQTGLVVNGDLRVYTADQQQTLFVASENGLFAYGDISTSGNLNAGRTITLNGPIENTSAPISLSSSNGGFTFTTNNFSTLFNKDGTVNNPNNSTAWNVASDRRLKTGIRPVAAGLDFIEKLRPVLFRYNADFRAAHPSTSEKEHFGVIAQEYAEVFPEFVTTGLDGFLSVDASPLPFVLAAAVKELHHAVTDQTKEMEALKKRNGELEKRLAELEAKDQECEAREQALMARLAKLEQFIPAAPQSKTTTAALKKRE